jgi:hypothetical protein
MKKPRNHSCFLRANFSLLPTSSLVITILPSSYSYYSNLFTLFSYQSLGRGISAICLRLSPLRSGCGFKTLLLFFSSSSLLLSVFIRAIRG